MYLRKRGKRQNTWTRCPGLKRIITDATGWRMIFPIGTSPDLTGMIMKLALSLTTLTSINIGRLVILTSTHFVSGPDIMFPILLPHHLPNINGVPVPIFIRRAGLSVTLS